MLAFRAHRCLIVVAIKLTEKHLVHRGEEPFDAATTSGLDWNGEGQSNFEIRADLLQMTRGEIAPVIGVEHFWDTTNTPARILFAPDGLTQRQ